MSKIRPIDIFSETEQNWYWNKQENIENLKHTLYEWSKLKTSLEIDTFLMEHDIFYRRFNELIQRHPDLADVVKQVKRNLGIRKKIGVAMKRYERDLIKAELHTLLPEWDEINQYHHKLKALDDIRGALGQLIVELNPAPDSGVPYAGTGETTSQPPREIQQLSQEKDSE